MTKLAQLTPTNLMEEKAKFLASQAYEPQFKYAQPIDPKTLNFYGPPQKKFFDHAVNLITQFPKSKIKPPRATLEQIEVAVETACQAANLPSLKLDFSHDHLSQVRLDNGTLFIRTPIQFTQAQLIGKIHHEIETHYFRILNNAALGFEPAEESYAFRSTEEGLANLHSFLDQPNVPMYKTCLSYIGSYLTQQLGFRAAFLEMIKLEVSTELSWSIITRSKRGLTDTSQPGGFTKDRTYLEGSVAVWQWLLRPENDIHDLYAGRISLSEVNQTKKIVSEKNPAPKLYFPKIIANPVEYLNIIRQIGLTNQFEKLVS